DCGSTCSRDFSEGESVILSPSPAAHSEFTGWSGACSGMALCEVTLGATDADVTAGFAKIVHTVSVDVTGGGSVSAHLPPISGCTEAGGTCSGAYAEASELTLTATPDAHQEFTGWTGCTSSDGAECMVTVGAANQVTASFAPITHEVSVSKAGSGQGAVT